MTAEDVKAKDFFKCIKTQKFDVIGEKDFERLNDEYFLLRDDPASKSDLNNSKQLALLQHKLSVLNLSKTVYQMLPLDEQRREKVKESLKNMGYTLRDGDAKDINNQFVSWIGQIKNRIQLAELNLINKGDKKETFNFAMTLVAFEHIIERPIDENLSLAKFIAYEKEANAIIKRQKKNG